MIYKMCGGTSKGEPHSSPGFNARSGRRIWVWSGYLLPPLESTNGGGESGGSHLLPLRQSLRQRKQLDFFSLPRLDYLTCASPVLLLDWLMFRSSGLSSWIFLFQLSVSARHYQSVLLLPSTWVVLWYILDCSCRGFFSPIIYLFILRLFFPCVCLTVFVLDGVFCFSSSWAFFCSSH